LAEKMTCPQYLYLNELPNNLIFEPIDFWNIPFTCNVAQIEFSKLIKAPLSIWVKLALFKTPHKVIDKSIYLQPDVILTQDVFLNFFMADFHVFVC
jgi:hypothetical protein